MPDNKHTPEPWAYGEDNDGWYVEKDVIQIAHGLTEEDARRITACVNACAGCATEVLETAPVGFFNSTYGHPKYLEEITKQRDELLAALENCRLLAARHRKEEWAGHVLRFCGESGVAGKVMR